MIGWYRRLQTRHIEGQVYRRVMMMLNDPQQGPEIARWLAKDPQRRAIYQRVSGEIGRASDAADLLSDLVVPGEPGEIKKPSAPFPIGRGALALAAVLIAAIGIVLLRAPESPHLASDAPATIRDRDIRLADGSLATLKGPARIHTDFDGNKRTVRLLSGTAIFSVIHDASRPFVVYAGGGTVTAIGTRFEVRVAEQVSVRLISGIISVRTPLRNSTGAGAPIRLTSGQQLMFDPVEPSLAGPAMAKRANTSFDDATVAAVVDATNRHSPPRIVLDDPRIGDRRIFADIDVSNPASVSEKLAAVLSLTARHAADGEIHLANKSDMGL